jgi:hypothetical protein
MDGMEVPTAFDIRKRERTLIVWKPQFLQRLDHVLLSQFYLVFFFFIFVGAVTIGGVFFSHIVVCLSAILFIFLFLPETRGDSLHQIMQGLKVR